MNITIHSRQSVEKLLRTSFPSNTAVISFYEPSAKGERSQKISFSGWTKRVFRVPLDKEIHDERTCFPEAEALAEFILDAVDDDMDILCQCEDGQTLSAGCAAAIHEYLAGDGVFVFADYRYTPDKMVFHKIYNALWLLEENNPTGELA